MKVGVQIPHRPLNWECGTDGEVCETVNLVPLGLVGSNPTAPTKNFNIMVKFAENNDERRKQLAKLSGEQREDYLINIINQLTLEKNILKETFMKYSYEVNKIFNVGLV